MSSQVLSETKQALSCDGCRRAIHWLKIIVGLGRSVPEVAHSGKTGSARVPVDDAVRGCLVDVIVGGGLSNFPKERKESSFSAVWLQFLVTQRFEKRQLLGIATENPGVTACP